MTLNNTSAYDLSDPATFTTLFETRRDGLHRLLSHELRGCDVDGVDPESAVQEVFTKAWAARHQFHADERTNPDMAATAWLYQIARRYAIDQQRHFLVRRPQRFALPAGEPDEEEEMTPPALMAFYRLVEHETPEARLLEQLDTHEARARMQAMLDMVLAHQRQGSRVARMFRARWLEGMSYKEIATLTHKSLSSVKAALHRMRRRFPEWWPVVVEVAKHGGWLPYARVLFAQHQRENGLTISHAARAVGNADVANLSRRLDPRRTPDAARYNRPVFVRLVLFLRQYQSQCQECGRGLPPPRVKRPRVRHLCHTCAVRLYFRERRCDEAHLAKRKAQAAARRAIRREVLRTDPVALEAFRAYQRERSRSWRARRRAAQST